ncbi:MAG: CopG family transcriptional regulator [uncultured Campylobacterales bacterium]|uniref:CopG family transcriptional regulator n=1 Tax=uncultured Campylobacterales bacterium TaxID=352960 RepID=A0A6S6S226_9BACT|nr:MAG: CopG family transcriptional regulator [uncultured Campylobacterales bacterium]
MKKAVSFRLDVNLLSYLDSCAGELGKTRTYLVEKAVSRYFDTLDEIISIDRIKDNKSEIYTLEEVFKKAKLDVPS